MARTGAAFQIRVGRGSSQQRSPLSCILIGVRPHPPPHQEHGQQTWGRVHVSGFLAQSLLGQGLALLKPSTQLSPFST